MPTVTNVKIKMAFKALCFSWQVPLTQIEFEGHITSKAHVEQVSPDSAILFPQTALFELCVIIESTSDINSEPTIIDQVFVVVDSPSEIITSSEYVPSFSAVNV